MGEKDQDGFIDEHKFEQFIELCKRMYVRLERENSFPWITDPENCEQSPADDQEADDNLGLSQGRLFE
jgi:hypothetical protein